MADENKGGVDLAAGVQSIFERVADFFHIFDLAFFVAGASSFGAFTFLFFVMGLDKRITFSIPPWMGVGAVIIACYICGLITFAAGRGLSSCLLRRKMLEKELPGLVKAHGLPDIQSNQAVHQYARMWAEVAQGRLGKPVLQHLSRYWAMAATYDAVAVSLVVWAVVFGLVHVNVPALRPLGTCTWVGMAVVCCVSAALAFWRGRAFYKYQIEDIVANFAAFRSPLSVVGNPAQAPAQPPSQDPPEST